MKAIRAKTFIDKEFKFPYHNRYCKVLRLCNILYHMKTKIYRKFSGKKEQGEKFVHSETDQYYTAPHEKCF